MGLYDDSYGTDESDAARILRQYKDRIEALENSGDTGTVVQIVREVNETVTVADTVTATVSDATSFTYGTDEYGYTGYGDGS